MRRKDREISDIREILEIVKKCDVCRLALNDSSGFPYILPLNFGYAFENDTLTFFFHSALEGKKHELIRADNRASFEMDCQHTLHSDAQRGYCTMNYESVTGQGYIEYVNKEEEKIKALTLLTDRYHDEHFSFNTAAVPRTSVYKLIVRNLIGKRK